MDKSCYAQVHPLSLTLQPISHLYGYQGLHPMWYVNLQVQKATNGVSFQQKHPLLLIQLQVAFLSIKNVQSLDELYRAKIILQFVLRNHDVLAVQRFQGHIQFRYESMVLHLHHPLLNRVRFPDDHVTSPINDVKGLCSDFQRNRSNHGIFYQLLFSHHLPPSFSMLQFWQMLFSIQWSAQCFAPNHQ